jgi:hypothetical protein
MMAVLLRESFRVAQQLMSRSLQASLSRRRDGLRFDYGRGPVRHHRKEVRPRSIAKTRLRSEVLGVKDMRKHLLKQQHEVAFSQSPAWTINVVTVIHERNITAGSPVYRRIALARREMHG